MTGMSAPPRGRGTRVARRRALSPEAIVTAALHVVDKDGIDALSMRRVAQELGTGAASLYAHVDGRDALVGLVLDRVRADIQCPPPDPGRWQEQVKDVMRRSRAVLGDHGDLGRLLATESGAPAGENAMRVAEGVLAILRAGGLPQQVCAYAVDTLALFVNGTVAGDAARAARTTPALERDRDTFAERAPASYGGLPADRFPMITGMVDELTRDVGDERFEFGLDLLVSGLARHAPRG